jgi:secondary thiamine-phosphate synthase enzyme
MAWYQHHISLPGVRRGCHLVTSQVVAGLPELPQFRVGLLNVFILHTSASLTINENADPDVRVDMETALNHLAPEDLPYVHTLEGSDDMPAHVKSSLMGASVTIPVRDGRLVLGTWQGIYLCEHRDHGGPRRLVLTLHGDATATQ